MHFINTVIRTVIKRPFIAWYFGLVVLIFVVIDSYNPIYPIIQGLNAITQGGVFESIVSFLQLILDPRIIPSVLAVILGISLLAALLTGLVFSGYMDIINNAIRGKQKSKGEFSAGLKKFVIKISSISFRTFIIGFLFIIFMLIASVPSIIITRSASFAKPGLILSAIFVNVVTVGILFFSFMYFRIYIVYWYAAAYNHDKKTFKAGKQVADEYFWKVAGVFLVFDIIFVVFRFILGLLNNFYVAMAANWLFSSVFFMTFIIYVFYSFKTGTVGNKR